jgi:uncharacterized protein YjiK
VRAGLVAALAALAAPSAARGQTLTLRDYVLPEEPQHRWELPGRLREISGLAQVPGDRLFAHDDERAVIYEIGYQEGRLLKAFAMGEHPVNADFEGIAFAEDRFYLVTSDGRIYESREGDDDDRMLFNTYGTGVGTQCEVEGLAFEPADRTLLLACKTPRVEEIEDFVAVYRFSLESREVVDPPLLVPLDAITSQIDGKSFRPSGIERHPLTGHYVIVAAQQSAVAEITPGGRVVTVLELRPGNHRQVEGITFLNDGTLVLADEGGRGHARLTMYPPPSR